MGRSVDEVLGLEDLKDKLHNALVLLPIIKQKHRTTNDAEEFVKMFAKHDQTHAHETAANFPCDNLGNVCQGSIVSLVLVDTEPQEFCSCSFRNSRCRFLCKQQIQQFKLTFESHRGREFVVAKCWILQTI